jgi:hypothetical protein
MEDFPEWGVLESAACLGNLGGESGLEYVQEAQPISGRGGIGWCQWTGPRRVQFEQYCSRNGLEPSKDETQYAFLFLELKSTEAKTIGAVARAKGGAPGYEELDDLAAKTKAFMAAFERPGIPHFQGRVKWSKMALESYEAEAKKSPVKETAKVALPVGGAAVGGSILLQLGLTPESLVMGLGIPIVTFLLQQWMQAEKRIKELEMVESISPTPPNAELPKELKSAPSKPMTEASGDAFIDRIADVVEARLSKRFTAIETKSGVDVNEVIRILPKLHEVFTPFFPTAQRQQVLGDDFPSVKVTPIATPTTTMPETPKSALQSTTILAGGGTAAAGLGGLLYTLLGEGDVSTKLPELILSVVSSLGGVGAIYGRLKAKAPIK